MSKNALFCVLGVFLGFAVGFFIANAVSKPGPAAALPPAAGDRAAGPLDPTQANADLPPGHPEIGSGDAPAATSASTSAAAQSAMEKADRNAKDFDAQMSAANVFYGLNDFAKTALYLDRALSLKPKDFDALVLMGNAKYDAGDFTAAEEFYARALEIKPDTPDVRTDLGNTYFRRSPPDYDRAISEYRKSIAIDPRHVFSWQNLAAAALRKNDKATATEAVERLAAISPDHAELPGLRESIAKMTP